MTMHQTPTVYINIQHDNTDNNHQPTMHTSTYDLHHDNSTTTTVPNSFMTHFPTWTTQNNDNNHQPTMHTSTYDLHHDNSTTTTVPNI